MTDHFAFFIIDCFAFAVGGFLIGLKLYPHRRGYDNYEKASFLLGTTALSFFSGLTASATHGLPDQGFSFYNFFDALVITFFGIWIFSAAFRNKFSKKINSFYANKLRPKIEMQYPALIRFT